MSQLDLVTDALASYPLQTSLKDGQTVVLQPAGTEDAAAIVAFARNLDEQDILFLRKDITEPDVVENWLANVASGETVSILAWQDDRVVGYATVDRNPARWTRRVGEIRVNVAPAMRSQGLGRQLIDKIFDIARRIGLKKLVAHMTPDQVGAQNAFSQLGFRAEALLADYVEDRVGNVHDLTIMTYDVDGFSNQMDAPLEL